MPLVPPARRGRVGSQRDQSHHPHFIGISSFDASALRAGVSVGSSLREKKGCLIRGTPVGRPARLKLRDRATSGEGHQAAIALATSNEMGALSSPVPSAFAA